MAARGVKDLDEDSEQSDSDYDEALYEDPEELEHRAAQDTKGWNLFRDIPIQLESGSMVSTAWVDASVKVLKLCAYIIVFVGVLGSAVIAKGTLLFITSQLKKGREIHHCNKLLALDQQFRTILSLEERITWLWAAWAVFSVPEIGIFLESVRICFFKTVGKPNIIEFVVAFVVDTLHTLGIAMLVLIILPDMDVVKGAMLMSALCLVPGVLNLISRDSTDPYYHHKLVFDVMAISAQITAFIVWPVLSPSVLSMQCLPFACLFISLGWWENYINYVDKKSSVTLTYLRDLRDGLQRSRFHTQRILSIWKILLFLACVLLSLHLQDDDPLTFFTSFWEAFGYREYTAEEVQIDLQGAYDGFVNYLPTGGTIEQLPIAHFTSIWVAAIQVLASYTCYATSIFACKILIQNFSFTFALSLVGPVTVNALVVFSGIRNGDACAFHGFIPDYLFFEIPPVYLIWEYIGRSHAWVWLFWLASQAWVTFHTWQPRCERLAATDKLFRKPWYSGVVIDQSLLLNRTKDDETEFPVEDGDDPDSDSVMSDNMKYAPDVKPSDMVSRIYICATMWHETREEMMEFLKSIFRLDEDQSAHRVARKYLKIINNDYYELETHIFMDDAFEISDHSSEDSQVNRFVKVLMEVMNEAASIVHITNVRLRPPKKYPTPYGGRLVWTLPGKTKLICHLKDKSKIRHRKRWSQVMYMYYLLGHRLMDLPISVERKEVMAQNTYLLALDGDIDFKPAAVHLLVDLMKKNKNLGAACGRIHPVGSGFMAWYQKFEYAIGHWLQKATEHMIGCVLCSPGCFSLFRGKALMDDNVMKKYTITPYEARHYVQYDQGEDRWLCTLLLQRGYRVEYSAASDAYTHCPEHFDEFFNQRRRWVPSTMANIFDLLSDYKRTVKMNDNISTLYILYQMMLMLGTILGPGTIFLMLVGALNLIMGVSNVTALMWNLVPIAAFIVICLTCKSEVQLMVANLITCLYAMMMMVVIVGVVLQIIEDGWLAPSSIFTVIVFSTFFVTAALHPQEIGCLLYLIIYYITIPSMYMLLIIYSLSNLNNVSWGTREVVQKKSAKELEQEKKDAEEAKKTVENQGLMKWLGKTDDKSGSIQCGIAGLFQCLFCTNPKDHKEDLYLLQISNKLENMEKKLNSLGATDDVVESPANRRRSSLGLRRETLGILNEYPESDNSTDIPREERDDLINPYWVEDPQMEKGEVDFLTTAETDFWKDFIDAYLRPIDENKEEQERIKTDLKNLRNIMVFAFVMLNTLFVLVIFMLQLNQDQLHFRWPLGQKVQVTYDDETNIITIDSDYLMLEPIGTMFIVFFGTVMFIQFTAMLMHRFGTLTHLLSTVSLDWYCTKQVEELSQHARLENNGVQIVKDLQKLNDADFKNKKTSDVGRRKTVQNLLKDRENKSNIGNLDANFKRRLTIVLQDPDQASMLSRLPSLGENEVTRRLTLRALQTRRDSVRPSGRSSQTHLYEPKLTIPGQSQSRGYVNESYEPAYDSDDDNMLSAKPRQSTVRFRETFT